MAAPTFVASYATNYTTTAASKDVTVTCQSGDTLVVYAMGQINTASFSSPTASNNITFETITSGSGSATRGSYLLCSALNVQVGGTFSITMTESTGTLVWGFSCVVVRNCSGWKSLNSSNGTANAPFLNAQTKYARSAFVILSVDGSAQDGTTRIWRTVNGTTPTSGNGLELTYAYAAGAYTAYAAFYPDTGTIGSKNVGLTDPATQTYNITGLELVGSDMGVSMYSRSVNYAATTSRSSSVAVYPGSRTLAITVVSVGVQPANGTDTAITTTATINGISMQSYTKVHSNNGAQGYIEMFYLLNPPTGPGVTVSAASSSSVDLALDFYAFNNVNPENPFTVSTSYGSSTTASVNFSATISRSPVLGFLLSGTNVSTTANGSPTGNIESSAIQNFNNSSDGGCRARQLVINPAASQTIGWTLTSGPWAVIAIRINPTSYFAPGVIYGLGL